jgi:cell division septation protein DedD
MTSFLKLERYAEPLAPEVAKPPVPEVAKPLAAEAAKPLGITVESGEYEIVLGRGQIASTSLVVVVLIAVFSGVSYLIGKSMAITAVAAAAPATTSRNPATTAPLPPVALPALQQEQSPKEQISTAPLFAEAVSGKVYIQVGVIDKGPAGIWAEGLRTHGLDAFVAPGPSDGLGLWRVMIGPLPDSQAYQQVKDILAKLGLTNFGRRYQQ